MKKVRGWHSEKAGITTDYQLELTNLDETDWMDGGTNLESEEEDDKGKLHYQKNYVTKSAPHLSTDEVAIVDEFPTTSSSLLISCVGTTNSAF